MRTSPLRLPRGHFLTGGFSVWPADFLGDFFKGSNLVVKFFGNVRRNGI